MELHRSSRFRLSSLLGINSNFTRFDRVVAYMTAGWSFLWWGVFIVVSILALTHGLTDAFWTAFWWWDLIPCSIVLGVGCTIWLSVGGVVDAVGMLKSLKHARIDTADNGFVASPPEK